MRTTPLSLLAAALLVLTLASVPAQAQLSRTFVSAFGNDANNCDRATPCRTFQGAHDKTNPDGEITVLDPGGYGSVTITKSISIVNDGVGEASVLVSGGVTGITITAGAASYINLRGITIQGIGFGGGTGLQFNRGFSLTMTNCVVRNHTHDGIVFLSNVLGRLAVTNTLIADNGGNGITIEPTLTSGNVNAMLNRVDVYQNSGFGVLVNGGFAANGTISVAAWETVVANNGNSSFVARSDNGHSVTLLNVMNSVSFGNNGFGFLSDTPMAQINVGQSVVTANPSGIASGSVVSYGDNWADGNAFPGRIGKN